MDISTIIVIVGAILGSNVITAVISGLFKRKRENVDALSVLQNIWHEDLNRLKGRVTTLETELKENRAILQTREEIIEKLMDENKQLRAENQEFKSKYEGQLKENKRLGERIRLLTKEKEELEGRILKLERASGEKPC